MSRLRLIALPALIALACGAAADEDEAEDKARTAQECASMRDQLIRSVNDNVEVGILIATAIPCGEDGVANRLDYFTSQVQQESIETLQTSFREACETYGTECSKEDSR